MAYRRQPYGGWGNYGGNDGGNDDDYAAPKGRAPRFDARQPPNRPWERNKAATSQDDGDRGVGNYDHNYGEKKINEEPKPAAPQKAQQNTPTAAAQTTDKYIDSSRTAYSKPGINSGRNDDYADPYGRGAATRFEARQPPNRPWERNKAASHEVDNKDDDDDQEEIKKGEPAPLPQKPQPYASGAAAQPTKNHIGGYGTASNKHAYGYNRGEDDMNVGIRSNTWANRRGGAGVERPVGYGQNIKHYNNEKNASGEVDGEEEELRRDFGNRFTLSPRREHVIPKKQGEASGSGGQPNVVVVKELKLYLENNKFENFAFNKKNGRNREKKQGN